MLTYKQLKEAEALALEASRSQSGVPIAICRNPNPGWWEFPKKPWRIKLHTAAIPPEDIIVGWIVAVPESAR